jgi:hypothetical protein
VSPRDGQLAIVGVGLEERIFEFAKRVRRY